MIQRHDSIGMFNEFGEVGLDHDLVEVVNSYMSL